MRAGNNYGPQTKFAKVMFSQVSVCPWGGVSAPLHAGIHPPGPEADTPLAGTPRHTPPVHAGIWSTSGQYASHWNAFLF